MSIVISLVKTLKEEDFSLNRRINIFKVIATTIKVRFFTFIEKKMAINPNPETVPSLMERDFGTCVLITDPKSDIILKKLQIAPNLPPNNRYSRPCGGKGGFDDYAEWLTE